MPSKNATNVKHLRLRLQGVEFTPLEIESLVRIEDSGQTGD
jgi:hypothetical protein